MSEYKHITHGFGPFIQNDSEILILGSFPSVRSREQSFFYGHPQNRFWPVLAHIFDEQTLETNDVAGKKEFLKRHHIALYDSIEECDIIGSSDAKIRNAVPADIPSLLAGSRIHTVFCNGSTSYQYLIKFHRLPINVIKLPSTSPANAVWTFNKLCDAWKIIRQNPTISSL
ncbi:MAG: DNA-deoxyinosine glycosylase [Solobacterium sp.]|nr:DNA-deoxyinosine glycosylase [Solobacterium sp.]